MMQVAFPSPPPSSSPEKYVGDDGLTESLSDDFIKLGFSDKEGEGIRKLERSWSKLEESVEESREEEEDDDGEEFSFAFVNGEGSPITADEAFEDGQIRPVFPLFNRDLLHGVDDDGEDKRPPVRKFFVEERDDEGESDAVDSEKEPLGPYCSWTGETVAEASPETCRKSNSTGFSKLWRFRDLVLRSNSDGRDAFVFLNHNADKTQSSSAAAAKLTGEDEKKKMKKSKSTELGKTTSDKRTKSAHEKLYMRNRALKEEGKHRSYLPYKQVGFFTNVNGLSRNIHPF